MHLPNEILDKIFSYFHISKTNQIIKERIKQYHASKVEYNFIPYKYEHLGEPFFYWSLYIDKKIIIKDTDFRIQFYDASRPDFLKRMRNILIAEKYGQFDDNIAEKRKLFRVQSLSPI